MIVCTNRELHKYKLTFIFMILFQISIPLSCKDSNARDFLNHRINTRGLPSAAK